MMSRGLIPYDWDGDVYESTEVATELSIPMSHVSPGHNDSIVSTGEHRGRAVCTNRFSPDGSCGVTLSPRMNQVVLYMMY